MAASSHLLFIPGLGCTPKLYAAQIAHLDGRISTSVADHSRGATIAEIAARILEAAPPRFALCGLSMGGYISFEIMRQAPERVERLALLDTTAAMDAPEGRARREATMQRVRAGDYEGVIETLYALLVRPSAHADAPLKAAVTGMMRECGAEVFLRQQGAILGRVDSRPVLGAIACKTLVLVGDQDALTPPAAAREMAQGIAGAKLTIVPDCGHMATMEQPGAVNAALDDWLA
jgi:pimeloyl-ACP methyl ester carboxylesterase